MKACLSLVVALGLAACGGDDGDNTPADASLVDSAAAGAVEVTCPASPAATVSAPNSASAYSPKDTTISQGQVVKFTMGTAHDVAPLNASSDPNLKVGFGKELCFMFTATGTFPFKCTDHGFTGSITVN